MASEFEKSTDKPIFHRFGILKVLENGKRMYPGIDVVTMSDFIDWSDKTDGESVYYYLEDYCISRIEYTPDWFTKNLPIWQKVWSETLEFRKDPQKLVGVPRQKSGPRQSQSYKYTTSLFTVGNTL